MQLRHVCNIKRYLTHVLSTLIQDRLRGNRRSADNLNCCRERKEATLYIIKMNKKS